MPRQSTRLSTRVKLEVKSEAIEPDVQEVSQPVGQSPEGQAATPAGAPPARTRLRAVGAPGGAVIDKRASSRAALAIELAKLGPKPPATDSSTWPASELGEATICKSYVKKFYRLHEKDLKDLEYKIVPHPNPQKETWKDMHLFRASDIERRAWQKHGGPARFNWYISTLEAKHCVARPGKPFNQIRWITYRTCATCGERTYRESDFFGKGCWSCYKSAIYNNAEVDEAGSPDQY